SNPRRRRFFRSNRPVRRSRRCVIGGSPAAPCCACARIEPDPLTCRAPPCTPFATISMSEQEAGLASPKKPSPLVLPNNRRREMIDWYCTVLGAEILYEADRISFISYDDEHHRVAFLDPGPLTERQPNAAGLNHVAFTFGSLDELTENYLRLKEIGIRPHRCVNHGVTTSMYYHDPDNNQVELLIDNFATAVEGRAYMSGRSVADKNPVGIVYEPDELVTRVRAGLRIEELASINA